MWVYYGYVTLFRLRESITARWFRLCEAIPATWVYSGHMSLFRLCESFPATWVYSGYLSLFPPHESILATWVYSGYLSLFRPHESIPATWVYSGYLSLFRPHESIPATWVYSGYLSLFRPHESISATWVYSVSCLLALIAIPFVAPICAAVGQVFLCFPPFSGASDIPIHYLSASNTTMSAVTHGHVVWFRNYITYMDNQPLIPYAWQFVHTNVLM